MTPLPEDGLVIADDPVGRRYEARLDGAVVGFADYRLVRERMIFLHTEVDPAFEGRGIGRRLAAGALDDVRARGLTITVKCPFIASFLQRHPEYRDLVATAPRRSPDRRDSKPGLTQTGAMEGCPHLAEIQAVNPSADGCEDCLRIGGWWLHLRLCLTCGHVGCCDESPNRHATAHFHQTGHPMVRSFEPGESWLWCFVDGLEFENAEP